MTERAGKGGRGRRESARISHFPKVGTAFGFPESERDYSAKSASL